MLERAGQSNKKQSQKARASYMQNDLREVIVQVQEKAIVCSGINEHLDSLFAQDTYCVYYRFIYYLIREIKATYSVELGVCTGRCTAHMAAASPNGKVLAIDPEQHGAFIENIQPYSNIDFLLKRSDSKDVLDKVLDNSIDLCFIDSVHAIDYTLKEVELWTPKMKSGSVFLFDDLELDEGMKEVLISLPFLKKGNLEGLHHKGFGFAIV